MTTPLKQYNTTLCWIVYSINIVLWKWNSFEISRPLTEKCVLGANGKRISLSTCVCVCVWNCHNMMDFTRPVCLLHDQCLQNDNHRHLYWILLSNEKTIKDMCPYNTTQNHFNTCNECNFQSLKIPCAYFKIKLTSSLVTPGGSMLYSQGLSNIRVDLKEMCINTRNLVDSADDRDYWRSLVNAALHLRVP